MVGIDRHTLDRTVFTKSQQSAYMVGLEYDRNQVNQEPNQVPRSGEILKAVT